MPRCALHQAPGRISHWLTDAILSTALRVLMHQKRCSNGIRNTGDAKTASAPPSSFRLRRWWRRTRTFHSTAQKALLFLLHSTDRRVAWIALLLLTDLARLRRFNKLSHTPVDQDTYTPRRIRCFLTA